MRPTPCQTLSLLGDPSVTKADRPSLEPAFQLTPMRDPGANRKSRQDPGLPRMHPVIRD